MQWFFTFTHVPMCQDHLELMFYVVDIWLSCPSLSKIHIKAGWTNWMKKGNAKNNSCYYIILDAWSSFPYIFLHSIVKAWWCHFILKVLG